MPNPMSTYMVDLLTVLFKPRHLAKAVLMLLKRSALPGYARGSYGTALPIAQKRLKDLERAGSRKVEWLSQRLWARWLF